MMESSEITMQPIGYLRCKADYRFEAPRQSTLADNCGVIELNPGQNYEQALDQLTEFNRIWVIYLFHNNTHWKPKVTPPRGEKKVGVFASRSPHRPNQIGLSCVEIEKVEGRNITIKNFDLLNGSPILDLKPYISYCDSFPDASTGWLPDQSETFDLVESDSFARSVAWVLQETGFDLSTFARVQLKEDPLNTKRKRIKILEENQAVLAYRTWRIYFEVSASFVKLVKIGSGYTVADLDDAVDKYGDKGIHREFIKL